VITAPTRSDEENWNDGPIKSGHDVRHGGSLATLLRDIISHAAHAVSQAWVNATHESVFSQCPQHTGADPPSCPA
jgi:hypothetical protein